MALNRNDLQHSLAFQLKAAREKAGLTQEEVADKLGITQPEVSKIENGQRGISILHGVQLANLYGTSVSEIMQKIAASPGLTASERQELRSGFFSDSVERA